jgi:hypothetical protein
MHEPVGASGKDGLKACSLQFWGDLQGDIQREVLFKGAFSGSGAGIKVPVPRIDDDGSEGAGVVPDLPPPAGAGASREHGGDNSE